MGDKTKCQNVGSMCDAIYTLPSKSVYFKEPEHNCPPTPSLVRFHVTNIVPEHACMCIQSNTVGGCMQRVG